ncbi:MAG: nicotinate (nicotinamide) nucleotide adenylyltransferase [Betaproteobacteria bacterium]|jgi:nicotinate-nucleotide adenylyltransferase|nr:nicotinate (nicotinamide) nucleotide adenylyltransferase [Betaproteobacteria bacterium]
MFGGAFDPPHLAHQAIAQAAITQLQLDLLYIVPTGQAWHKTRSLSDAEHRTAMARLAFEALPLTVVDDLETQRTGPSYTVDTLLELNKRHPHSLFYVLIGADQAANFTQWHQWEMILDLARLVVVPRPTASEIPKATDEWHNLPSDRVLRINMPLMNISSSLLRASYALGNPASAFVSPHVDNYIQQNQLYLEPHDRSR